jgi:hypothetical protein
VKDCYFFAYEGSFFCIRSIDVFAYEGFIFGIRSIDVFAYEGLFLYMKEMFFCV